MTNESPNITETAMLLRSSIEALDFTVNVLQRSEQSVATVKQAKANIQACCATPDLVDNTTLIDIGQQAIQMADAWLSDNN
jgi:hypothetical protein